MARGVITAIKGALQKFVGFGEFIVTSEFFSKSAKDVASIGKVDDAFQAFYERYPEQYHAITQFYVFPQEIGSVQCVLIIRAKKDFTRFPEMNRFYDRREFFYYGAEEGYKSTDVVSSLPNMINYQEKLMGRAPVVAVKPLTLPTDKKNFHKLAGCLLKRSILIQSVNPENQLKDNLKLVTTINGLPEIYLKYMGYGLGVSKDAFADRYFHAYTTIFQGNEMDLFAADTDHHEFIDALLSGTVDYPDTELLVTKGEITKDALYDLINFHRLHYDVDNQADEERYTPHAETFNASQQYVAAFIRYAEADGYILKRIMLIYAYWTKRKLMTAELFTKFWKDIAGTKTSRKIIFEYPFIKQSVKEFLIDQQIHVSSFQEIESLNNIWSEMPGLDNPTVSVKDELRISLVRKGPKLSADEITVANQFQQRMLSEKNIDLSGEIMSKFDLKTIPDKDQEKVFRENWKQLPEATFGQLLNNIGPDKLYTMLEEEPIRELFLDQQKNYLLNAFLDSCAPATLLKWASLFEKEHFTLGIDIGAYAERQAKYINGYGEFDKFEAICDLLPSNAVTASLKTAQRFLDSVFSSLGCQRLKFYERSIKLCELFKSKIQVRPKKTDLSDLIAIYLLVVNNEAYIAEAAETIASIQAELTAEIPGTALPINFILKLQNGLSYKLPGQATFIESLLTCVFRQENADRLRRLLDLFDNIVATGKNYYIRRDTELFKLLSLTPAPREDDALARFKQIEHKLKHSQSAEVDVVLEIIALIKQKIKQGETDKPGDRKDEDRNKNEERGLKQWFSGNKSKVFTGFLIALTLITSAGCAYFYLTRNSQGEALKEQTDQIRSLKRADSLNYQEIVKLQDSINKLQHPQPPLSPKIDMELPGKDLKKFDHKLTNLTLEAIIDTIYKRNPKNIGSHYQQQRKLYGEMLIKLNPGCFTANKVCTCDALPHIPGRAAQDN